MASNGLTEFSEFFNHSYDIVFNYAIVITAVATLCMALVEVLKSVLRLKGFYLRYKIKSWINNHQSIDKYKARDELLCLAVGYHDCDTPLDWWDQPEEKFFPRLHSAAETALDFPDDYPHFYEVLTQGLTNQKEWKYDSKKFRSGTHQADEQLTIDNLAVIRARIGGAVSRRLDTLQMQVEWYWAKLNQVGAVAFSVLIFILFAYKNPDIGLGIAIGIGVLTGFLAPFVKDLVSRISGIKLPTRR